MFTLKVGNLASAGRKYVMQFQHRVAGDKIAHKLKKKNGGNTLHGQRVPCQS